MGKGSLAAHTGSLHHLVCPWPAGNRKAASSFPVLSQETQIPPGAGGICKCLGLIPLPCWEVFICDNNFHSNRLSLLAGPGSPWKSRWKEGTEKAGNAVEKQISVFVSAECQASAGQSSQGKRILQESSAEDAVTASGWG